MKNKKMDEFVRVGHLLIELKQFNEGYFLNWLADNSTLGKRQCQRLMRVARNDQLCSGCHSLTQAMRLLHDYDERNRINRGSRT